MSILKMVVSLIRKANPYNNAVSLGVNLGKDVRLVDNPSWGSEPYLISIGDGTLISGNVTFITHDMSTRVFKQVGGREVQNLQKYGKIVVGKNCFIGMRSMLLPGVTIGDNCIVAAGAIVTKNIPQNQVWGGIPAKFLMTLEDYQKNCEKNCLNYSSEELRQNKKEVLLRLLE